MRKNMAPKKKQKKNLKVIKKKAPNIKQKKPSELLAKFKILALNIFTKPFLLINLIINSLILFAKNLLLQLYSLTKSTFQLLSNIKEAFFSILFGLLAGGIGSVILYSYLDLEAEEKNIIYESKILESEKVISLLKTEVKNNETELEKFKKIINDLNTKLESTEKNSLQNKNFIDENSNKLEKLFTITDKANEKILSSERLNTNKILELEKQIQSTSKIMLSSSKSELSDRLYLAKSLVNRLKSGVPYSPQLVALGQEGLDPALLRFAKGGAPTLSALAARSSARAGELRDAMKTKSDNTWKESLKDEISKLVKIKPTNAKNIKGMEGVLLRAEEAISKGNLEKAISEIDSLDIESRGVLDAWLKEAKAKKDANIAAENILAKTTAALKIKN